MVGDWIEGGRGRRRLWGGGVEVGAGEVRRWVKIVVMFFL